MHRRAALCNMTRRPRPERLAAGGIGRIRDRKESDAGRGQIELSGRDGFALWRRELAMRIKPELAAVEFDVCSGQVSRGERVAACRRCKAKRLRVSAILVDGEQCDAALLTAQAVGIEMQLR